MPTLLSCNSRPDHRADGGDAISVLEIAPSRYDATGERADGPALADDCRRWSLTRRQAETFFTLSEPIATADLHDFDLLPCAIVGRLRADGRIWAFEINGGASARLRSGEDVRLLGCRASACAPLVLSIPLADD